MDDDIGVRRPQDPAWRVRIAHRSSSAAAVKALRDARQRRGWSMTRAARETGVSRPMISLLEAGLRRPSWSLAWALISGYGMTPDEADALRSIARQWVGWDSPYRTGVAPGGDWKPAQDTGSDTFWDTQGNGKHPGEHRETEQPAVAAGDWIEWARKKAEAVQASAGGTRVH